MLSVPVASLVPVTVPPSAQLTFRVALRLELPWTVPDRTWVTASNNTAELEAVICPANAQLTAAVALAALWLDDFPTSA
jgi:hypothetical protein